MKNTPSLPHQALPHSTHFLPFPKGCTGVSRWPLPSLPGAKVCHAETTFRQQCTEMWRSAPRSLQHFGAAENEVLFLREKPKSIWRQSSTAWLLSCQRMAAHSGHWVGTFVLGRWPGSVKSYCGVTTYNRPGTVLRHSHASPYSKLTQTHKVGSNSILAIRKSMLWRVMGSGMVRQPETRGGKTGVPVSDSLKIHIISFWAKLSCLEEEAGEVEGSP